MKTFIHKMSTIIISVILSIVMLLFFVSSQTQRQYSEDAKQTADLLAASESVNVEELETTIAFTQESFNQPVDARSAIKYRFINAMILGDSIAEGLVGYRVVDERNCVGKRGARIDTIDENYELIFSRKPKALFLEFGMNDIEYCGGDANLFYQRYVEKIDRIQSELPNTSIYINAILPIDASAIAKRPVYGNYPSFNEKLVQLCQEKNLVYIDNSAQLNQLSIQYEFDGIHPRYDYYFLWAENMANIAGL